MKMKIDWGFNLIKLVRLREWYDKILLNLSFSFFFLLFLPNFRPYLNYVFVLIVYQSFLGAYGCLLNSYCDKEADKKVGRNYYISYYSKSFIASLLSILGFFSITIPIIFKNIYLFIFGVLLFLLTTFYSLKPIRFKDKGIIGFVIVTLTQGPLIFLMFILLVGININFGLYLLVLLALIFSFIELTHQKEHFEQNKKTGTKTLAVRHGIKRLLWLFYLLIFLLLIYALTGLYYFRELFLQFPI